MDFPSGFVELDRRFSQLDDSTRSEEAANQSYLLGASGSPESLHWPDLLKLRLVVILGEPGSGKSWEFRHVAAALNAQGREAFYIQLENLVTRSFSDSLGPEDEGRFDKWRRGNWPATFFMDSVDETKIRRAADFHGTLRAVRAAVGTPALKRASFIVSSRISEWRPVTDRGEVQTQFHVPLRIQTAVKNSSETQDDEHILIVQIDPLDPGQVSKFAAAKLETRSDEFVAAIGENHAWEFARRPVDVSGLIEFWQSQRRLGTLTEIIEHDVRLKLLETIDRHQDFPLSEADARIGAETLAAATILCKEIRLKVPDDSLIEGTALDGARCLPAEWKPDKCRALLSRAIFDSATYGTIRFHHRRTAEYLAASWLRRCVERACPTDALVDMLFADIRGARTPRLSLIPVIAWLCDGNEQWNDQVRSCVLESVPELHLEHGDAAALPVSYRRSVLSALIRKYEKRSRVWLPYSSDALQRLASPDLASDISGFLRNPATSTDVRARLITMVRFGRLKECLPVLIEMLNGTGTGDELQTDVLAALRDMGTEESLREAWAAFDKRQQSRTRCAG
jgi:hypothetical protein